jgi:hypothetical protein
MKKFICLAVLAILISGCQTTDDFIGTGPITLSDAVANHYQNSYLKGVGPQYYVITEDGRDASYVYCAAGTGECQFDVMVLDLISRCEKRTGQKCFIFDEASYVVWKGPVSYGGQSASKMKGVNAQSLDDARLCKIALEEWDWNRPDKYKEYVKEAQSRNLTLGVCRRLAHSE